MTKTPDKNKESSIDTAQEGNVQIQRENTRGSEKGKTKIVKIVDLGVDSDCSELDSKSEEESPERVILNQRYQLEMLNQSPKLSD